MKSHKVMNTGCVRVGFVQLKAFESCWLIMRYWINNLSDISPPQASMQPPNNVNMVSVTWCAFDTVIEDL